MDGEKENDPKVVGRLPAESRKSLSADTVWKRKTREKKRNAIKLNYIIRTLLRVLNFIKTDSKTQLLPHEMVSNLTSIFGAGSLDTTHSSRTLINTNFPSLFASTSNHSRCLLMLITPPSSDCCLERFVDRHKFPIWLGWGGGFDGRQPVSEIYADRMKNVWNHYRRWEREMRVVIIDMIVIDLINSLSKINSTRRLQ